MAFGKKKEREQPGEGAMPDASSAPEAEPAAPSDGDGGPGEATAVVTAEAASDAGTPAAEAPADEAAPSDNADGAADAAAPGSPSGGDALGGADLLSMFQSTQAEMDDKTAILELAGEVEIDDLIEDLQTIAAALGIKPAA